MSSKTVVIIDDDPIFVFVVQKLFFKIGSDYKIDSGYTNLASSSS